MINIDIRPHNTGTIASNANACKIGLTAAIYCLRVGLAVTGMPATKISGPNSDRPTFHS